MHARRSLLKAVLLAGLSSVVQGWAEATGPAKVLRDLLYGTAPPWNLNPGVRALTTQAQITDSLVQDLLILLLPHVRA